MEGMGNMQNINLRSFHTIYNNQGKFPKPFSRKSTVILIYLDSYRN